MTDIDDRVALPPEPASAAAARRWVTDALRGCHVDISLVTLLVSELVSNAVLHAKTPLEVSVASRGDRIRVTVSDSSSVIPAVKNYGSDSVTGRGLTMVASSSAGWGIEQRGVGKAVWFEVEIAREPSTW